MTTANMVRAHFMVENGAVKAEVARQFEISPRTLGRWLDKVNEARYNVRVQRGRALVAAVEAGNAAKEGTVQRRKVWEYVNPNPTMCADKKVAQNRVRDNKMNKDRKPAPTGAMADAFNNAKVAK